MKTYTQVEALTSHEDCRQHFIRGITECTSHLDVGQVRQAQFALLQANASVAQGMIWAEMLGIDPAGWYSRMLDISALWERCENARR